jgi:hypothetical protein
VSSIGLFIIGTFVSLLVLASVALLSWGAVLDGREQARQGAEVDSGPRATGDREAVTPALDALPLPHGR